MCGRLLTSYPGYGFTVRVKELVTDRRAGKILLNVAEGALALPLAFVPSAESVVAVVNSEGRLLAFGGELLVWYGDKSKSMTWKELREYRGERAQHGAVLPRGWPRKVDRLEAVFPEPRENIKTT